MRAGSQPPGVADERFPDRDEVAAVRAEADALEPGAESGERRRLAGRIMARRDLGKLMFCDLVDRSGRIQLMLEPADLDLGDIVGVQGVPAKSRRGEPSLKVDSLELLAKIRRPLPDVYHGLQDVETRHRQRAEVIPLAGFVYPYPRRNVEGRPRTGSDSVGASALLTCRQSADEQIPEPGALALNRNLARREHVQPHRFLAALQIVLGAVVYLAGAGYPHVPLVEHGPEIPWYAVPGERAHLTWKPPRSSPGGSVASSKARRLRLFPLSPASESGASAALVLFGPLELLEG